jgi:hypothetical protein
LTAKIVPTGLVGVGGRVFTHMRNKRKEIAQVLDFQRFAFLRNSLRILYASFTQCVKSLIFNVFTHA